jgi:hypothetical protein
VVGLVIWRAVKTQTHFTTKDSDSDSEVEESGCVNPDDLEVANSSKLTVVLDCNGVRFCRVCNEFLNQGTEKALC